MSATLTITVTDAVVAALRDRAAQQGTTPEAVAAKDVAQATLPLNYGLIRNLAGKVRFSEPNVANRHHDLLGDALIDELRGKTHE